MRFIFTLILIISFMPVLNAQNREKAFEINEKLGRGINYGNMFEAPGETTWGNQWQPEYPKIIAELGFDHVRIPVRWEPASRSSSQQPYTIYSSFLNRIKEVVDSTLNAGLYAIINMHHHEALYENPDEQEQRFLSMWGQISEFFKNYPDSLLFEVLNEPHGNLVPQKWNILYPKALDSIRAYNPERIVLIGTANYGGLGGLPHLEIPEDNYTILTIHYYNPFQFTHQGAGWVGGNADDWLGTKWLDSETEREVVRQEFAPLEKISETHNIPVHIGEFGAYSKADMKSRARWTTFLSRFFESKGWSWAYWEFSAGFGIYNPGTETFNQELVDALLHNEIPEPSRYVGTEVYASNFQNSDDGWKLNTQSTASGNIQRSNGALEVTITSSGTSGWHVQLVKGNLTLENGKKYRYTFKAKAESSRSLTSYIGKNSDPWTAYSGYNGATLTDTFSVYTVVFDMQNNTDNSSRMVFDLGTSDVDVIITDIKLEEIVWVPPTKAELPQDMKIKCYPNPVNNKLIIHNPGQFTTGSVMNMQGKTVREFILPQETNNIQMDNLSSGIYILHLKGKKESWSTKIYKN